MEKKTPHHANNTDSVHIESLNSNIPSPSSQIGHATSSVPYEPTKVPVYMSTEGSTSKLNKCLAENSQIVFYDFPKTYAEKDGSDQASDMDIDLKQKRKMRTHLVGFAIQVSNVTDLELPMRKLTIKAKDKNLVEMKNGNKALRKVIEFENSKKLEKGSVAHEIEVVHNEAKGIKVVLKLLEKEAIDNNEVLAMINLNETQITPTLVCVSELEYIKYFMEYIYPSKTLRYVMDHSIEYIYSRDPELGRKFVFDMFSQLLSSIRECHSRGWSHGDLHSSNILIKATTVGIKYYLIDWGQAKNINCQGDLFEYNQLIINDLLSLKKSFISFTKRCIDNNGKRLRDELEREWWGEEFKPESFDQLIPSDVKDNRFTLEEQQKIIGYIFEESEMSESYTDMDINTAYQTLFL